jgi:hypothetical protein
MVLMDVVKYLAVGALEDPTLDGAFESLVRRMHGAQHNCPECPGPNQGLDAGTRSGRYALCMACADYEAFNFSGRTKFAMPFTWLLSYLCAFFLVHCYPCLAGWLLGFLVSYHETKKPTFLPGFTWLVLGEDPAARSHRVEQFTAL